MAIRLNRILDDLQLTQILSTIFRNSLVVKRAIALFQRRAISEVIFQCVEEGDRVYSRLHGCAIVVFKERDESKRLPRIWLELEDRLEIVEPCYLCSN